MSSTPFIPEAEERVLSTLEADGSRRWLNPRLSKGRFWSRRRTVAYALIALYTIVPFLRLRGKPALLLDVARRQFTILGVTFLPTDMPILALFLLTAIVSIFLVTALVGRVWCGWACPQTVYLEFVFRPIERLFTGRAGRGGAPADDRVPGWRRPAMYAAYALICLHLANTFLAYFVPATTLSHWILSSPADHPAGFTIVVAMTCLMMFNFAWFREQTCIIACPYGRLQSVLLDRHSLIISYDATRGEPRTRATRVSLPVTQPQDRVTSAAGKSRNNGDCIDCAMCVQVCPTGIDIRRGLQIECIGCAQCIDACDAVMDKIKRPRGLIHYSSQSAMASNGKRFRRPRLFIYAGIVSALLVTITLVLATRAPAEVTVLRSIGRPFVVSAAGTIENTLLIKITNRGDVVEQFRVTAVSPEGVESHMTHDTLTVEPNRSVTQPLLVVAPAARFSLGHLDATIRITSASGIRINRDCRLIGPTPSTTSTTNSGAHANERR